MPKQELDIIEGNLREELDNAQAAASSSEVDPSSAEPGRTSNLEAGEDASKSAISLELESKQKELVCYYLYLFSFSFSFFSMCSFLAF